MIISKSNIVVNNTITLNAGTLTSGSLDNVKNSDFSKVITSTSGTFSFSFSNVGSAQYVGLHGLSLPVGTNVSITATGFSKSFTTTRDTKNLVFYNDTPSTLGTLKVQFMGVGTKTVSFIQAGLSTVIKWGVNSGQSLYYLGKTSQERISVSQRGVPINRVKEEVSPTLQLTMNNMLKSWARTDFQDLLNHYDEAGVLSILDYEEDDLPDESVAGFDLKMLAPKSHTSTKELVNISLSLRVVA